jgi:hypothetical protein
MRNYFVVCLLALVVLFCFAGPTIAAPNLNGTIDCSAATDTQFVPSWGQVDVGEDQYSRYIYQWMYWHDINRLQWLITNGDSTFEPDAFFYDYDGTAYGDAPSGYWASDLPDQYVDTQLSDWNENAVTIGSGRAVMLASARIYYTVTRMTSGGGSSSWIKLLSQRGRQWPVGCVTTGCSFGCSTSNNYFTMPFNDDGFTAPGCRQYWWQWNTTVRGACN